MVVSSSAVIWHDLECGAYAADLPLWSELAMRSASRQAKSKETLNGSGTLLNEGRWETELRPISAMNG